MADRKDRRLKANHTGKRQCVVIMRERDGRSLPFVVRNEGDAVPIVRDRVGTVATIYGRRRLGLGCASRRVGTRSRVNHSVAFMDEGVCTNQAESFFMAAPMIASTCHQAASNVSRDCQKGPQFLGGLSISLLQNSYGWPTSSLPSLRA